ncbi:MAG TPA: DNRLRE domain-containing protein [Burkholderiaceae bacterium]|nr:DNRLRE domain-containing protein [Burkholderiaceae bacterium]
MKQRQRGLLLLPVVLTLSLIAAVSLLASRGAALNAALTTGQAQADQLRYAAESALQHQSALMNAANCGTLADLPNTTFGTGGYSYEAQRTSAMDANSRVNVTATGRLGSASRSVGAAVVVYGSSAAVAPTLGADADANLDSDKPDRNYGASDRMFIRQSPRMNALLRFDLAAVPSNAKIVSAQLVLYQESPQSGGAGRVAIHRVTRPWVEGNKDGGANTGGGAGATWLVADQFTTWTTAGGDYDPAIAAVRHVTAQRQAFDWEIGPLVQQWLEDPAQNHGMLLRTLDSGTHVGMSTREDSVASRRPKLNVTYLLPCNSVPRTIGIALSAAAPLRISAGTYDIAYTITLKNLSSVPLSNLQVTNNVAATFSSFTIQGAPTASAPLTPSAAFTGSGQNTKLLSGEDTLPVGDATYTIQFTVRASGLTLGSTYASSATATTATAPGGAPLASYQSNSGDASAIDPASSSPTRVRFIALAADGGMNGASGMTNVNYGASTSLLLHETGGARRIASRADLTPIPANTPIQSASLRWHVPSIAARSGSPMVLQLYRLTQSWVEGTRNGSGTSDGVTWARRDASNNWTTPGGTYATPAVASLTVPASFNAGFLTFDVTSVVQQWINGTGNFGVVLLNSAPDQMSLSSREAASNPPELVLTY